MCPLSSLVGWLWGVFPFQEFGSYNFAQSEVRTLPSVPFESFDQVGECPTTTMEHLTIDMMALGGYGGLEVHTPLRGMWSDTAHGLELPQQVQAFECLPFQGTALDGWNSQMSLAPGSKFIPFSCHHPRRRTASV